MSDGTIKRKLISWRNFERIYPFLFSVIGIITYFCIPKTPFVLSVTKKFTSTEFLNSYMIFFFIGNKQKPR